MRDESGTVTETSSLERLAWQLEVVKSFEDQYGRESWAACSATSGSEATTRS